MNSIKKSKVLAKKSVLSSYIPYAFHYNHQSILTKNGELIIVLKLLNYHDDEYKNLIIDTFNNERSYPYSLWITTINEKNKKTQDLSGKNSSEIKNIFDKIFDKDSDDKNFFLREIFISFVFNDDVNLSDFKFNLKSLITFSQKNYIKKLKDLYFKSMNIVNGYLLKLKIYNPKILSIFKEKDVYFCEILNFFSRINFVKLETKIQLGLSDLSNYLCKINNFSYKILNGNIIKIQNEESEESSEFCGIFSIKSLQNKEFNMQNTDYILDNEFEFISTEILIRAQKKEILQIKGSSYANFEKNYFSQEENFDIIENNKLLEKFLQNSFQELKDSKGSKWQEKFILKKNIFCIKSNSIENLNINIKKIFLKFIDNGLPFLRENIFIDQIFWCQMPGNFNFFNQINISINTTALLFNNFNGSSDDWRNSLVFKSKYYKSFNKIYLKGKKIFLLSRPEDSENFFLIFLIFMMINSNAKIYYFDEKKSLEKIFEDLNQENIMIKNINQEGNANSCQEKRNLKEIFGLVLLIIKMINLIYERDIESLDSNEAELLLKRQKDLAKKITIELNENQKDRNLLEIIKIFIKTEILDQKFLIFFKDFMYLNTKDRSFNNIDIYEFKANFSSPYDVIIFILFKIINLYFSKDCGLFLGIDFVFVVRASFDFSENHYMFVKILNEFSNLIKIYNIYLVLEFKINDYKNFLTLYKDYMIEKCIFFTSNPDSQKIIKIINPNFSSKKDFFDNLLLIINQDKFIINEFPTIDIEKELKNFL